jgi:hypothetical protein
MLMKYNDELSHIVDRLGNGVTYSDQLDEYCRNYTNLSKDNYLGVFTQDYKPPKQDCCFIINTATKDENGVHWCGVFIKRGVKYFFDSFGRNPSKLVKMFDNNLGGNIMYDDTKTQQNKEMNCGQRCIAFLVLCSKYNPESAVLI